MCVVTAKERCWDTFLCLWLTPWRLESGTKKRAAYKIEPKQCKRRTLRSWCRLRRWGFANYSQTTPRCSYCCHHHLIKPRWACYGTQMTKQICWFNNNTHTERYVSINVVISQVIAVQVFVYLDDIDKTDSISICDYYLFKQSDYYLSSKPAKL